MPAIGRRHNVVGTQHIANADRHRFLTDRQMHRAFDLVGRIDARDFFFSAANKPQRAVNPLEIGGRQRGFVGRAVTGDYSFQFRAFAGQTYPLAARRRS